MGSVRVTLCAGAVVATALAAWAPSAHATDSGNVSGNVSVVPASPVPGTDIQVRARGCGGRTGTAASTAFVTDARLTQITGRTPGTLAGETRVRSSLDPGTYEVRVTCDGRQDKITSAIRVGGGKPTTGTRPPKGTKPPTAMPSRSGPSRSGPVRTGPARPGPASTESQSTESPPSAEPSAERPAGERPVGERSVGERSADRRPSSPSSPVAPVRAGGGGAAAQLAAADPVDARGSDDPANSTDDARHTGPGARHAVVGLVLAGVAAVAVVARGARRGRDRRTE
ncbi:hypothetical protein RM704_36175 [Streptomyces sp. DSM 3412]|uniref:Serine/threonine protein kinase n=1 Tax=Streptomyces gottesmaniae TaxID=3075518 RepID=A0ABU2ZBT8_9ACTN|nr:hypothetical protein [Streptomyces sp. DSM 3412]MDT0572837.1 hypothetical protein [Streptomyces sp. DSM 3412]